MSFSNFIKKLREEKSLSQNDLAKILKVSNSSIRNLEAGRTKFPRHELFDNLKKYVGGDDVELAYNIFFVNDKEEYGYKLSEINKLYLSHLYRRYYVIVPVQRYFYNNDKVMTFDGVFWKSGFPYYRALLGNYNKEKYIAAIKSKDKINNLKEAIYFETLFIEFLENLEQIREVRFVLDANNKDDCLVFEELSNISLLNIGKEVAISYVLFDTKKKALVNKYYVTSRRALIVL